MTSSASYHPGPDDPTPEQRLLLMDDVTWEKFIEECANQLQIEGVYTQVIRLGSTGDKGRDVCGYTVHPPMAGTWDLYQAKHYVNTLSPADFAPELAKFLTSVYDKAYTCPRRYYLCALKIGTSLIDYILTPDTMKSWILAEWKKKNGKFDKFTRTLDATLEAFVSGFDFSIIYRLTPHNLLEIHRRNPVLHWQSFGILEKRGPNPLVPNEPDAYEEKYIKALLDVYAELAPIPLSSVDAIPTALRKHFRAQRRLFYCAEGLNRFSRDKLPGAFDDLLDQIELGVGSVVTSPHSSGMERLLHTLEMANSLPVTSNPLGARLFAGDLQGGCHHLANQERLCWVESANDE